MSETNLNGDQGIMIDGQSVQSYVQQYMQAQMAILSRNLIQNQQEIVTQQGTHQQDLETSRRNHESQMEQRRTKIDMIKVATDTLAANAKSKPTDERDITASDITAFAEELIQYINQE